MISHNQSFICFNVNTKASFTFNFVIQGQTCNENKQTIEGTIQLFGHVKLN